MKLDFQKKSFHEILYLALWRSKQQQGCDAAYGHALKLNCNFFVCRLRELELAPTPEQKQEILKQFKLESEPVIENKYDYIIKALQGLLAEDKFSSFLNIRKGKVT